MRGAIGLLLYIAVIVLSSVLKKAAEQKSKQAGVFVEDEGGGTYTITLEDMLAEKETETVTETVTIAPRPEIIFDSEQVVEELPEWEELEEFEESTDDVAKTKDSLLAPGQLSWRQAIVLAEIIGEPRAKRPWPSR